MKDVKPAGWRRRLGAACAALGILLSALACVIYFRYVADPSNLHAQERLQHAGLIGMLWSAGFYGSMLLFFSSILGTGWGRWVGIAASVGAWIFGLMTLGAMCGPFGC